MDKQSMLSAEEIYRIASIMVRKGIRHIRLTGGEPLLRKDVTHIVERLNALRNVGLERISMTTNGFYLSRYAEPLKKSGLDDINVSVDSIDPDVFRKMTGSDLSPVLEGVMAAKKAGIPIKLNCVLVAGENSAEILDLIEWARRYNFPLRFIEYMPLDNGGGWNRDKVFSEDDALAVIRAKHSVEKLPRDNSPATRYKIHNDYEIGFISTVSKPFCESCDRLRITASGELYTCLFSNKGVSLKDYFSLENEVDLEAVIATTVWHKGKGFRESRNDSSRAITMHMIGG
jgi:cyclic pyranopterin phosphate synthase